MATLTSAHGALKLRAEERILCEAARDAKPVKLRPDQRIRAKVLRRLLLGQALQGGPYPLTPAGVILVGATIQGRLDFDNVVMPEGGPLAALELRKCVFEGGFSGKYGRFSRLSFEGSRFRDLDGSQADPTVDLSGAAIESDLSMRGVRPSRKTDHLWIRAIGARIDGQVNLSCSHLRAPAEQKDRLMSDPAVNALNLTLAKVQGDFQFLNGARSEGSISARRAVIRGDVWMSGALIEGSDNYALLFQSAEIGGLMMLDGRAEDAAGRGDCRRFRAFGQLNLNDLQLGGTLSLSNVELRPPKAARAARGERRRAARRGDDSGDRADPAAFICLRLDEAHIGDSVQIDISSGERSRLYGRILLDNMEIKNSLEIQDVFLGIPVAKPRTVVTMRARFLIARHVSIVNVEPLLWEGGNDASRPDMMALSMDFEGAKVESFTFIDSWLNGCLWASSLKCVGDVALDVRIGGGVDLEAAEAGGSLDISELRLDPEAEGLNLQDAVIGHTLKLTQDGPAVRGGAMRLVKARRRAMGSLRSMELVECLWCSVAGAGRPQFFQTGFLVKDDRAFLLDGKEPTFDSIVGHFGHSIREREHAVEFVRLYCAYVHSGHGARTMIADRADLPPFVRADPSAVQVKQELLANVAPEAFRPAAVRKRKPSGTFTVSGWFLHGNAIVRAELRLSAKANPVRIKLLKETPVAQIVGTPRVNHQFFCHPENADPGRNGGWIMPPAAGSMEEVDEKELAALGAKLVHHVQTSCAIHGKANLTGLVIGMLDDNSGRSWGADAVIPMNHFVYSRTIWIGKDAENPEPFLKDLVKSLKVEAARRLPSGLVGMLGWTSRLKQSSDHCSGWQARLNWIYRQYDISDLAVPSRYRITQADYSPQPFEQAIKVCRAEGREDYALHFEIEKQKIEWRLRNRRNRLWFLALGLTAAAVWLALTGSDEESRWPVAFALAFGIAGVSYAANFALRYMFGYLRRPVRAIATLVAAFLIGWGGVHIANERHLMVVDVEPVAGLAARDPGRNRFLMGSQNEARAGNWVRNVHCDDTISEALYALDVLIPLIDLREESHCQVGVANDFKTRGEIEPKWVGIAFGSVIESERFWAAAKAVYAIAGWFIVSLSILTFAQANRTRTDPS